MSVQSPEQQDPLFTKNFTFAPSLIKLEKEIKKKIKQINNFITTFIASKKIKYLVWGFGLLSILFMRKKRIPSGIFLPGWFLSDRGHTFLLVLESAFQFFALSKLPRALLGFHALSLSL